MDTPKVLGLKRKKMFSGWAESCAYSIWKLLDVDEMYQNFFKNAKYCNSCLQVIRDADFGIKALARIQEQLNSLREKLVSLLKKNYDDLEKEFGAECFSYGSSKFHGINSYGQIIRSLRDALSLPETDPHGPQIVCVESNNKNRNLNGKPMHSVTTQTDERPAPKPVQIVRLVPVTVIPPQSKPQYSAGSPTPKRKKTTQSQPNPNLDRNSPSSVAACIDRTRKQIFVSSSKQNLDQSSTSTIPSETVDDEVEFIEEMPPRENDGKAKAKSKKIQKQKQTRDKVLKRFPCAIEGCRSRSTTELHLQNHIRAHHKKEENPYHCHCGLVFGTEGLLKTHEMKEHTEAKFACLEPTCTMKFHFRNVMKNHFNNEHDSGLLKCQLCYKKFPKENGDEYSKHLQLHEIRKAENIPLACVLPDCNKEPYVCTLDLRKHVMRSHHDGTRLKCSICDFLTTTKTHLESHMRRMHCEGSGSEVFLKCSTTGCKFVAKLRTDLKGRKCPGCIIKMRVLCPQCGKVFPGKVCV
jgi:hypothetical protein